MALENIMIALCFVCTAAAAAIHELRRAKTFCRKCLKLLLNFNYIISPTNYVYYYYLSKYV